VAHSAGPTIGVRLNRWLEFAGTAALTRIESKFIQEQPVDPVIASLLGISSATEIVHRVDYLRVPTFMLRLSHAYRTGVAYASGGHSLTPGNGLFLTSYAYVGNVGYTYTGLRRWSLSLQGAYLSATSVGTIAGDYTTATGTASIARRVMNSFYLHATYSARRYSSPTYLTYNRFINAATAGVSWSPGEIPLRLW